MRVFIRTYGCQMNERDSEAVGALLLGRGYEMASGEEDADIVILNTCSVRAKAERKALGKLGLLTSSRRHRGQRIVGVVGCMAQRLGQQALDKVAGLDFVVGTRRFAAIPYILERVLAGDGPIVDIGDTPGERDSMTGHFDGKFSAFVNILEGCSRRCAYCIVPAVRGNAWSRSAGEILKETRILAERGVREITYLGQSVTDYGRDRDVDPEGLLPDARREAFPGILVAASEIEGIERIRFTSGHPSGCTSELAAVVGAVEQVCDHVHLPLQSGSDRILGKMVRGYTTEKYRAAVERLRDAAPEISITTDIIVGFPTETIEDFEMTRAFMEEIGFDNSFVFKYSPRPGTRAAEWDDDVSDEEKLRRNHVLLSDQEDRARRINERLVGQEVTVLAGGVSLRNKARWSGRTTTNKIVVFEPDDSVKEGDLVTVLVDRVMPQSLYGRLVRSVEHES